MRSTVLALARLVACGALWSCGPLDGERDVIEREPVAEDGGSPWREGPRLPQPIANNAVVAMQGRSGAHVMTFFGIDSTKTWSGVTDAAYRWDTGGDEGWRCRLPGHLLRPHRPERRPVLALSLGAA